MNDDRDEIIPIELQRRGLKALAKELGPAGLIRFMQQFDPGSGDYTRDRDRWLSKVTMADIAEKIRKKNIARRSGHKK